MEAGTTTKKLPVTSPQFPDWILGTGNWELTGFGGGAEGAVAKAVSHERVITPMRQMRARGALLLDVRHLALRGDFPVPAGHTSAGKGGETKQADKAAHNNSPDAPSNCMFRTAEVVGVLAVCPRNGVNTSGDASLFYDALNRRHGGLDRDFEVRSSRSEVRAPSSRFEVRAHCYRA